MKNVILVLVLVAAVVAALFALNAGVRYFSAITTSITVHQVEPGIRCALASTSNGTAIDCWQPKQ